MNKNDLIRAVAEDTGLTVAASEKFLNALVSRIQIAAKNGIAEDEAAKVFAREDAARTAPGNYIQNQSGGWMKK